MPKTNHGRRRLTAVAGAILALVWAGGCAAHQTSAPAPLDARAVPARSDAGSLETEDAALAASWRDLRTAPTADGHRALATRYLRLGVLDAAIDQYDAALRLDPKDAEAYDGRARAWRDAGLPGVALGDAHRALHYAPRSAAALNTLGTVLQAIGRLAEARHAFERAVAIDGGAAYALTNLCAVAFLERDLMAAERLCRRAVAADPALREAHTTLAVALAHSATAETLRETLAPVQTGAAAEYAVGQALAANRRFAEAADAFMRAAAMDPAFAHAREDARRMRARTPGD